MTRAQSTLFDGARLLLSEAIELTIQSLKAYGADHDHWCIAWSGGKDSTATLTLLLHLIETGQVPRPKSLTVFYADTRLELTPLALAAMKLMEGLRRRGNWVRVVTVMAPLDKRFMVYVLGRGVPPPNNNTLRWCTRQIKVEPMTAAIETVLANLPGKVLMITGVRIGESAVRDARIALSCGRDGAECGQGWYQEVLPNAKGVRGRIATLAPLLHWRVCHVWEWLKFYASNREYGGWPTADLADAYGGDEAEEIAARMGCVGCPLASKDLALQTVLALPQWAYLGPLRELKPLWRELRKAKHRKRKAGVERLKSGAIAKNPQRQGPIKLASRLWALEQVLGIQARVNEAAERLDRPRIDLLNPEEEARIRELIAAGTWPDKWSDADPDADIPLDAIFSDGSVQPLLVR